MPRVTAHSGARKGPVARTFLSAPAARNAGPTNSAGSAPCTNIKNCVVPQKYETYVYMCAGPWVVGASQDSICRPYATAAICSCLLSKRLSLVSRTPPRSPELVRTAPESAVRIRPSLTAHARRAAEPTMLRFHRNSITSWPCRGAPRAPAPEWTGHLVGAHRVRPFAISGRIGNHPCHRISDSGRIGNRLRQNLKFRQNRQPPPPGGCRGAACRARCLPRPPEERITSPRASSGPLWQEVEANGLAGFDSNRSLLYAEGVRWNDMRRQ